MAFFKNFPVVSYKFGNNEAPVLFDDITIYVDLIDQIRNEAAYYQKFSILDNERPDTISQKLYGTPDYHWTFFLMNEHIRESGWPLTQQDLFVKAKKNYPHRTVVTQDDIGDIFVPGDVVTGQSSGSVGTVVSRNLDLGQIVIDSPDNFAQQETLTTGVDASLIKTVVTISETPQYLSTHHFELDGEYTDIDPHDQITSNLVPVTYFERLQARNDELKEITVLKPNTAAEVVKQYQLAMKN